MQTTIVEPMPVSVKQGAENNEQGFQQKWNEYINHRWPLRSPVRLDLYKVNESPFA